MEATILTLQRRDLSNSYRVVGESRDPAHLRLARRQGAIEIGNRTLVIVAIGGSEPGFVLRAGREVIAIATGSSDSADGFDVAFGDDRLRVSPHGIARRHADILCRGRQIGEVEREGALQRTVRVSLPAEIPLEVALFSAALVILTWTHEDEAAALLLTALSGV